jgi:hypothetical protein
MTPGESNAKLEKLRLGGFCVFGDQIISFNVVEIDEPICEDISQTTKSRREREGAKAKETRSVASVFFIFLK